MANWRSEYDFLARFIQIDGKKMHYLDEGEGTQPIVCVHGNPTWSFYYRRLLRDLRGETRVIAIDHVGCGLSEKPLEYNYTLAQHTSNLVSILDRLDLKNVLMVVHDWGGAIGLGAAVARPDRIGKLMILNTAAFPPPYVPLRIAACRFPVLGSFAIRYLNAFAGSAVTMAVHRKKLTPNAKDGLLAPYSSPHHRVAIDRFVRDIPLTKKHPTYATLETLESGLKVLSKKPAAFVWGMRDWCFRPECLERLRKHFPDAKVRKLEDVGHYVMEEAPEEVIEEVRALLTMPGSKGSHGS